MVNGNGNGVRKWRSMETEHTGQCGGGRNAGGEQYITADVRKMPDGRYGVYADKFKNKKKSDDDYVW